VANHGQWPTIVAPAAPSAPWNTTSGPPLRSFSRISGIPRAPSTCNVVLKKSTGISAIRNTPAVKEAAIVFTATGRFLVASCVLSRLSMPALLAVSPKRESGPCTSAGVSPR